MSKWNKLLFIVSLPFSIFGFVLWFGKKFRSDSHLGGLISLPSYLEELEYIFSLVETDDINYVLDIGSNVGMWSSTLLSLNKNVKTICIEPNPQIFPLLVNNMSFFFESIFKSEFSGWKFE